MSSNEPGTRKGPVAGTSGNQSASHKGAKSMSAASELGSPKSPSSPTASGTFKGVPSSNKHAKQSSESVAKGDKLQRINGGDEGSSTTQSYGASPSSSAGNLAETTSGTGSSMTPSALMDGDDDITDSRLYQMPRPEMESLAQRRLREKHHKFQNLLSRTKTMNLDDDSSTSLQQHKDRQPSSHRDSPSSGSNPQTAPLSTEKGFRDMMGDSSTRNRSSDRAAVESEDDVAVPSKQPGAPHPSSNLISNFVSSSSRAADGLGRAGNRFFTKFARSGSSHEREVAPENYQLKVITKPLVEQTRLTRIRKHMDLAKDKTEFWMPALPYRCIDYLNHYGVEVEGLYRIPGSGREIKQWQMRFDTGPNYDVDLLDDSIELYDINVVGSMLKTWLRDLPDELFPKAMQTKISTQCQGAEETPQVMRDELSKLPPFNYYLLFAITCHISLLHSHSDKNKMNYHNLCVCFQPSLKVDGFCFNFLVTDWRNCWQGCWTEKDYLLEETKLMEQRERAIMANAAMAQAAKDKTRQGHSRQRKPENSRSRERHPSQSQNLPTNGDSRKNNGAPHETASNTPQNPNRPRTPPSLEPVANVSPMRM